jgi:hypothetical protein
MAKTICRVLGVILLVVGIAGFLAPGMMGMHLRGAHNLIHIVSGAIAAFLGWRGSYRSARLFCLVFGAVYGLLGIAGLMAGPGIPAGMANNMPDKHLLVLIPGSLEFGTADSIIHVILGVAFLVAGLVRPRVSERFEGVVDRTKSKLGV